MNIWEMSCRWKIIFKYLIQINVYFLFEKKNNEIQSENSIEITTNENPIKSKCDKKY